LSSSIYKTKKCQKCGARYWNLPAHSPNLSWWEHSDTKWCVLAVSKEVMELREEIESLKARQRDIHSEHIEI